MKKIPDIIPFPCDAESSPFFGALASALLPALGYTGETPFFCGPKNSNCVNCGNCGNKTTLMKHHLQLYHDYQTFTGVSVGWAWPEDGSEYNALPGWEKGWNWPDAFFQFIFKTAGLDWTRLSKRAGKERVWAAVKASIDAGRPVLMKLGDGPDWHVATGYDENGTLFGLDAHAHFSHTHLDAAARASVKPDGYTDDGLFILADWFALFDNALVITGRRAPEADLREILSRLIHVLSSPVNARLEADLMARLDNVTPANAWETAQWLLVKVGFPIEARWHAADSSLIRLAGDAAREKIFGMIRQYVFDNELDATHGTCWKIWGQLGVGPNTGYALPSHAGDLLLKPETRAELKRLFAIVFENDRIVLNLLREAAGLAACPTQK